jgi:hypothetical protein
MVSRSILLAGHGLLLLWSTLAQLKPMWCMHSEPVPAQPDTTGLGLRVQEAKLEHFGLTTNYITVGGHRNVLQFLHSTHRKKIYIYSQDYLSTFRASLRMFSPSLPGCAIPHNPKIWKLLRQILHLHQP